MQNQLPAGLLDENIEFFVCDKLQAYKLKSGRVITADQFDEPVLQLIDNYLVAHPVKQTCLDEMGITVRTERINQTIVCNWGGFDHQADVVGGVLQATEHWACPKRGNCPWEGRFCDSLQLANGQHLTRREVEIIKYVALGYRDKEIAALLDMSVTTVTTHRRNIRDKGGLEGAADFTRFAITKNLIQSCEQRPF
jgi:DNA-binding CsgD family transcriptional regulator